MEGETLLWIGAFLIFIPLGIILLLALTKDVRNSKRAVNQQNTPPQKSPHGDPEKCLTNLRWLDIVKELFINNEILEYRDILVKCGVPKEIVFSGDSQNINTYYPFAPNSDDKARFNTYALAISNRYYLQNAPLQVIDPAEYNLNLTNNEILYLRINLTTLYEEKVTQKNITYSGMRWNNGILRAGTLSLISNEIRNFVPQDCGRIFITDKRIIFIGKQNNITKAILLKNIVTYTLYQDGVMINQPNKKVMLFKFDTYNDDTILIQDGINEFVIVLNRLLSGTEKSNFTEK